MRLEMFPNPAVAPVAKGPACAGTGGVGEGSFSAALAHSTRGESTAVAPTPIQPKAPNPSADRESTQSKPASEPISKSAGKQAGDLAAGPAPIVEARVISIAGVSNGNKPGVNSDLSPEPPKDAGPAERPGVKPKANMNSTARVQPRSAVIAAQPTVATEALVEPELIARTTNASLPTQVPTQPPMQVPTQPPISASSVLDATASFGGSFLKACAENLVSASVSAITPDSVHPLAVAAVENSKNGVAVVDASPSASNSSVRVPLPERSPGDNEPLCTSHGNIGTENQAGENEIPTGLPSVFEPFQSLVSTSSSPDVPAREGVAGNSSRGIEVCNQIAIDSPAMAESVPDSAGANSASPLALSSTSAHFAGTFSMALSSDPLSCDASKLDGAMTGADALPSRLEIPLSDYAKPSAFRLRPPPAGAMQAKELGANNRVGSPALHLPNSLSAGSTNDADAGIPSQPNPGESAMESLAGHDIQADPPDGGGVLSGNSPPSPDSSASALTNNDFKESGGAAGKNAKPDSSNTDASTWPELDGKLTSSAAFGVPGVAQGSSCDVASVMLQVTPSSTAATTPDVEKTNPSPSLPPAQQMLDSAPVAPEAPVAGGGAHLTSDAAGLQMHVDIHTTAFGNVEIHTVVEQSQVGVAIHGDRDLSGWFNSEIGGLAAGLKGQHLNLAAVDFSGRSGVQTATSFQQGQPRQNFSQGPNAQPASMVSKDGAHESEITLPAGITEEPQERRVSILA